MRDFLIKVDNQVDLLSSKGITLTPGDFVYALKKKCLPGIVQAVQEGRWCWCLMLSCEASWGKVEVEGALGEAIAPKAGETCGGGPSARPH